MLNRSEAQLSCWAPFTVAVFSSGPTVQLVRMEADPLESAATDAASRGHAYRGFIAVIDGVPSVRCEPGLDATEAMLRAGVLFAEMFGPVLKEQQTQALYA